MCAPAGNGSAYGKGAEQTWSFCSFFNIALSVVARAQNQEYYKQYCENNRKYYYRHNIRREKCGYKRAEDYSQRKSKKGRNNAYYNIEAAYSLASPGFKIVSHQIHSHTQ